MNCPHLGCWRAWLDGESADASHELAAHLAECAACQVLVADLRDDADRAAAALRLLAPDRLPSVAETRLARRALERHQLSEIAQPPPPPAGGGGAHAEAKESPMTLSATWTRWRVQIAGLAAVLLAAFLIVGTPGGRGLASEFLAQFRGQRFTAVTISQSDARQLATNFGGLGRLQNPTQALGQLERVASVQGAAPTTQSFVQVASVDQASQRVGFRVRTPDPAALPAGVSRTPEIYVMPAQQLRLTFDKQKAASYFQAIGHPEVSLPDKFDGSTLVVQVPAAVLMQYAGANPSDPGLIVGQAGQLTASVEGQATLAELREFLLGLPGLPQDTLRQLREMDDWQSTIPIPIPTDLLQFEQTTIAGGAGLILNDNTGLGSAAIWQQDGQILGLAAMMKATDLRRVADSIH